VSERVLIVDGDPFIRAVIATTLEAVAGVEIVEAPDGIEALAKASALHPRLVFLDVDMPRLDGIETCRGLRRDPHTRGATIVMLTASDRDEVEAQALGAGADLLLTKPFSPLDLLRLVDDLSAEAGS
jgi:CheY-like chemotaxis protein